MGEVQPEVAMPAWLTVTPLEGRTGLRLAGEADLCTVPALRRAVAELPADAREIHLQLAGLEFIDVATARFLVTLTERPGRPAVILHYPPPCLIRVIRLAFPGTLARFRVHDVGSPLPASWRPALSRPSSRPEAAGLSPGGGRRQQAE
jgi:ABC-type transporter Mla MlaB component